MHHNDIGSGSISMDCSSSMYLYPNMINYSSLWIMTIEDDCQMSAGKGQCTVRWYDLGPEPMHDLLGCQHNSVLLNYQDATFELIPTRWLQNGPLNIVCAQPGYYIVILCKHVNFILGKIDHLQVQKPVCMYQQVVWAFDITNKHEYTLRWVA